MYEEPVSKRVLGRFRSNDFIVQVGFEAVLIEAQKLHSARGWFYERA